MNFPVERVLCDVAAGRLFQEGNTVRPEKKRGKIKIIENFQESLKHFQWFDNQNPHSAVEDFIVFPDAAKFQKVVCTEGRVFMLDYQDQKTFYWFQEEDDKKDKERCGSINTALGNNQNGWPNRWPPGSKKPEWDADAPASSAQANVPPVQQPLMSQNFQNPFIQPPAAGANITQEQLAKLFQDLGPTNLAKSPKLSQILSPEVLDVLSQDEEFQNLVVTLLPEGQQSLEFLRDNLLSPQLQQAMDRLGAAANSEAYEAVMTSLGLRELLGQVANSPDGIEAMIRAMQLKEGGQEEANEESNNNDQQQQPPSEQ